MTKTKSIKSLFTRLLIAILLISLSLPVARADQPPSLSDFQSSQKKSIGIESQQYETIANVAVNNIKNTISSLLKSNNSNQSQSSDQSGQFSPTNINNLLLSANTNTDANTNTNANASVQATAPTASPTQVNQSNSATVSSLPIGINIGNENNNVNP